MTQVEKDTILQMHSQGYNTVEIATKLKRNNSSIGRYLKKQGLATHRKGKLTESDIENIKELYLQGMTSKDIFVLFQHKIQCEETIQGIVRKMGISRHRGFRNEFNHDYFETIDTANKAYFLGILLADGNVHKPKAKGRQCIIQIGLKGEDKYILDKLQDELQTNKTISVYRSKNRYECHFSVYSNKMATDLSKYNIVPNKTFLINKLPNVPSEFIPDLIRGVFDGDGTVYILKSNNKLRFGFYGTHNLVHDILNTLKSSIDISLNKITDKDTVSCVSFGKPTDIMNFYYYIYYSPTVTCLQRKKQKFEQVLF